MTTIDPADSWRRAALERSDVSAAPQGSTIPPERTERLVANARYQAFASGGEAHDRCYDYEEPDHDYDPCVRDVVERPVLFLREASDATEVSSRDVQQKGVGDCYMMAALAALTDTPDGRSLVRSAISENRNDKGEVVSYTVTLHKPESHWLRAKTFSDVSVTVDGTYVIGHAVPRDGSGLNEVWPLVIEKAYAQYNGGYNAIGHGGNASDAMEILTGREATRTSLRWAASLFRSFPSERLQGDLAAGKLIVLQTRREIGRSANFRAATNRDSHGLQGDHAYEVTGTEERDGHVFVRLHNPWGHDEPGLVPFDELSTWFDSIHVGSAR
jgi:hypothetical protein